MNRRRCFLTVFICVLTFFVFMLNTTGTAFALSYEELYEKYFGRQSSTPVPSPQPPVEKPVLSLPADGILSGLTVQEQGMFNLINEKRAQYGCPSVKLDMDVTRVARMKSKDMVVNNYYAHLSPIYGGLSQMLNDAGIKRRTAGDILVKTYSVERAVELFMGSSVHRMHLLKKDYTHMGVGIVPYGGKMLMVTVIFIKK